ncbi:MAG: hypothetical protein QXU98_01665 [Candidatus Parvarchaeota archaeon]
MEDDKKHGIFFMINEGLDRIGITDERNKIAIVVGYTVGYLMRLRGTKHEAYWDSFWDNMTEPLTPPKLREVFEKAVDELYEYGQNVGDILLIREKIESLSLEEPFYEINFYFIFGLVLAEALADKNNISGKLFPILTKAFKKFNINDTGRRAAMVVGTLTGRSTKFHCWKNSAYWNTFFDDVRKGAPLTLPDLRNVFVKTVVDLHRCGFLDEEIISLQYEAAILCLNTSFVEDLGRYFTLGISFGERA